MVPSGQSDTNRLLGYAPDTRLLIINADDFGRCHAVNEAIVRALDDGVVSSTSLMVPCPWALHAMNLLGDRPNAPFGVHLTVVCDTINYRWGPVLPEKKVSSLIDETGYFYSNERIPELLIQAELNELEAEFRAQIEAVLAAGLEPTHLDWHCLRDGGSDEIFYMTLELAREYDLALRAHSQSAAEELHRMGLPANDHEVLDSYDLDPTDASRHYTRLLRTLPDGLSEWAVHPGLGNAELRTIEPTSWQVRQADFDFMTSQEAQNIVEDEGIILLDYRALQAVWSEESIE